MGTDRIDKRIDRQFELIFYLACFVFLYLQVFYFPATSIYYESDHVNLLNDAKRITEGEFIYRDFFEFTFPGAATLYAALMLVAGPKYWLVNAVIILHGLLAAFLGIQLSRRIIGDTAVAYLPSAIFIFFGFRWLGIDGEHRMISPLFCYLAVLILVQERTVRRLALAGVACAFASFFSQQRGVLAAAAISVFVFCEFGIAKGEWGRAFRHSFVLGAAFLASLALLLLPFVILAGPSTFFDCTIGFLRWYIQDPQTNSLRTFFSTLTKVGSQGVVMLIVSLFYSLLIPGVYVIVGLVAAIRCRRSNTAGLSGILLLSCVGFFLALGSTGPNASRLFQIGLPAVIALCWLIYQTRSASPILMKAAVACLAIFGILLGIRLQLAWDATILDTPSGRLVFLSPVIAERYEWLLENAKPDDMVYETYNSHVNFPLGLRNPSRMSILLNSGYSPPEHVARAIEDLKRAKPRYIIWDGTWTNESEQDTDGKRLGPFYRYLEANYTRIKAFTPYDGREREIWERSDHPRP
ncbi:MAG: hypothetical protein AB7F88_02750 [Pyrinomonadaceae bacterium]